MQIQLATVCSYRNGFGADETSTAYENALILADRLGETPMRIPVLHGLWVIKYVRGQKVAALAIAQSFLTLVGSGFDTVAVLIANRIVGASLNSLGRFNEAQEYLARAHSQFDPVLHKGTANRFGTDLGVTINCTMACNLWALGETRSAIQHMQDAEQAAERTGHINSICFKHHYGRTLAMLTRDESELQRHLALSAGISAEHKLVLWQRTAEASEALLVAGAGDASGIDQFMEADVRLTTIGTLNSMPQFRIGFQPADFLSSQTRQSMSTINWIGVGSAARYMMYKQKKDLEVPDMRVCRLGITLLMTIRILYKQVSSYKQYCNTPGNYCDESNRHQTS